MKGTVAPEKANEVAEAAYGRGEHVEQRSGGRYVARAELVLARPEHWSLGVGSVRHDPMQLVAAAMSHVRSEAGEEAEVVLDLVPVPGKKVARRRRQLVRRASRRGQTVFGERVEGAAAGWGGSGRARQTDLTQAVGKFVPQAEVFEVQLLVRVAASHPARARARLHQMVASVEAGRGENWWRLVGPRRGPWRVYSNVWWRRRSFDRRFERGEFAPARRGRQWVTTREIGAWLKPPTRHCAASNVRRTGGVVPPAPAELLTWKGQPGVVPLGAVVGVDGRRRLGAVPAKDVLFAADLGRSGNGKSELAAVQTIALAYAGEGAWFLDPHGAALQRMRPYLAHPAINSRLWDIDLAASQTTDPMAAWNPLSMEGRKLGELDLVVGSVAGAIAAAQRWSEKAPRAYTIVSHAVQALAYLSWDLCREGRPDLQPTIFQITPLVTDEEWREAVVARLPARMARWWRTTFPDFPSDASTVVTRLMDDLELSPAARAFLGQPRSTYSAREAMDTSRVVLLRPPGVQTGTGRVLTSMLLFDLFLAGLGREGTDPETRRTLWAYADELTAVDGAGGGTIAAILEQLRKYEVRLTAATQMAMRLSPETRGALMQNQTLLLAAGADADEAAFISKRLPGLDPETLVQQPKFQYVCSAVVNGKRTDPFRVFGVPVHEVYADYYRPEGLGEQARVVDANLQRRPIGDVLADADALDQALMEYLTDAPQAAAGGVAYDLDDNEDDSEAA